MTGERRERRSGVAPRIRSIAKRLLAGGAILVLAAGEIPLGDRPLIVLTRREETPPVGEDAALYSIWVDLHGELAAESTRGRQQFVDKSGHFIAVDQPSKVIDAIREVVELAKHGSR
jgi:hypothetical protein